MDGLATISPRNLTLSKDSTFKNQNISPANSEMGNKGSSEHEYEGINTLMIVMMIRSYREADLQELLRVSRPDKA